MKMKIIYLLLFLLLTYVLTEAEKTDAANNETKDEQSSENNTIVEKAEEQAPEPIKSEEKEEEEEKAEEELPEFYYSLRIGDEGQDFNLVIDSTAAEMTVFEEKNKNITEFIIDGNSTETVTETVEINGVVVKNFTFEVDEDEDYSKDIETHGILGLGIDLKDESNTLIDKLHNSKQIEKKVVYISVKPQPTVKFLGDIHKDEVPLFTHCNLTKKSDLDEDYQDGWVCDFSHILFGDSEEFNDTIEIDGRAIFDTTSNYIYAPMEYLNLFLEEYELNKTCKVDEDDDEVTLLCKNNGNNYTDMDAISFLFDGYAYSIPGENLFKRDEEEEKEDEEFTFLIKFSKEKKNIWTFGYPFFSEYVVSLDYDNLQVGFKGEEKPVDFSEEWSEWIKSKSFFTEKTKNILMIAGAAVGGVILLVIIALVIRKIAKASSASKHHSLVESH